MNRLVVTLCGIATVAVCAGARPAPRESDDSRLAAALQGYEQSGPAVSCVSLRDLRGNKSAGDAILFDGPTSSTLWVNRPAGGCPDLNNGRALQTRTTSTQLCRGDIATVFDTLTGTPYGGCGLADFTPYRRVKR